MILLETPATFEQVLHLLWEDVYITHHVKNVKFYINLWNHIQALTRLNITCMRI